MIGKKKPRDYFAKGLNYFLLTMLALSIIFPFYYIVVLSFNEGQDTLMYGNLMIWPRKFTIENYSEHSLDFGSKSRACCYIKLRWDDGRVSWGVGTNTDIIRASGRAMLSAVNELEDGLARPGMHD